MSRTLQRMEEMSAHGQPMRRSLAEMSYGELLQSLSQKIFALANKERLLVQLEVEDQVTAEILLTRRLVIGAGMVVFGANMIFMTIVFALARFIPPWATSLVIGLCALAGGWALVIATWRRHKTVSEIQSELKEKLSWTDKHAA
ncbi:MAG TPA: phage holin family protein [Planktothrix sp.]